MKALNIQDGSIMAAAMQNEIRRSSDSRYDHRLHGLLLIAQGWKCPEVAEVLGDSVRTIHGWVHRFQAKGFAGLEERSRPGRPSRLVPEQMSQLQEVLRAKPCDVGMGGNLWDGKTMSAYVAREFHVQLKPRQCRSLLRHWRFRYRKPRPVIARADPQKQAAHKKTPRDGRES